MSLHLVTEQHYFPGADTNHCLGYCAECDAYYLIQEPLARVEEWFRNGRIGPAQFEAFTHVWAPSTPREETYDNWLRPPTDLEVLRHVELLRAALEARFDLRPRAPRRCGGAPASRACAPRAGAASAIPGLAR